jgi:DeoR/GlpR family transcriptional regulator of sugar metabolism
MSSKKQRRQNEIINLLSQHPALRVNDLAEKLNVTPETIRRDLDQMHANGVLERTYGGAILQIPKEPGLNIRHKLMTRERELIAKQVVQEIKSGRHFMIGSGATTVHIARRMAAELTDITVLVHSFGVATELSHNPTIRVLMAPGFYNAGEGANHGSHTINFLNSFWADYAIVSASGLLPEGPCDALVDAGEVYATMISRSFKTVLAADKSKFNLKFPSQYAQWRDIDYLITDQMPTGDLATALDRHEIEIQSVIPAQSV